MQIQCIPQNTFFGMIEENRQTAEYSTHLSELSNKGRLHFEEMTRL